MVGPQVVDWNLGDSGRRGYALAAASDLQVLSAPEGAARMRIRKGLLLRSTGQDLREGGEAPRLPLDELDPEVQSTIKRAHRFADFLDWLVSERASSDNPFESDLWPPPTASRGAGLQAP